MTIYTVWTKSEFENELVAMFTNLQEAQAFVSRNPQGLSLGQETAFNTDAEAMQDEDVAMWTY